MPQIKDYLTISHEDVAHINSRQKDISGKEILGGILQSAMLVQHSKRSERYRPFYTSILIERS